MGDSENKNEVEKQNEPQKTEKTAKKKGGFFKSFKAEFKRIIWPDKETVGRQTAAVLACSVALGLIIALLDLIIKFGLSFIL